MNDLQFREPGINIPRRLRSFSGRTIDQMPTLLSGKDKNGNVVDVPRVPMTPKQVLYERAYGKNRHDRKLLRNADVDTACAIIGNPDRSGEFVVGLYSDPLVKKLIAGLNPRSYIREGSLQIDMDVYQTIKKNGLVISSDKAHKLFYLDDVHFREKFWDYVIEGDAKLIRKNLSFIPPRRYGGNMEDKMGLQLFPTTHFGLNLLCILSIERKSAGLGRSGVEHLIGVEASKISRTESVRNDGPYREKASSQSSLEEALRF